MSLASVDKIQNWSANERETREHLAAVYQIFGYLGMDDLIYTHISARIPGEDDHFLINPFGLMYEEITAANLVKINLQGEIVEDSEFSVNYAGFIIHGAVHELAEEAHCVIHLHTDAGVAVSCQKDGLLEISQHELFANNGVAYHDYEGLAFNEDEKPRLVADLGNAKMMLLRNHGTLTVGATVAEAFFHMYNLERACRIQVLAQAAGNAELNRIPENIVRHTRSQTPVGARLTGYGEMELAAWIRKLDRLGLKFRD